MPHGHQLLMVVLLAQMVLLALEVKGVQAARALTEPREARESKEMTAVQGPQEFNENSEPRAAREYKEMSVALDPLACREMLVALGPRGCKEMSAALGPLV